MHIKTPYLLFLGDAPDQLAAKTAYGIAMFRPEWCIGQLRLPGCRADVGLPDMDMEKARANGASTLVIGVANRGGVIPKEWTDTLMAALHMGYDIASGLHGRLNDIPELCEKADVLKRQLLDLRHPVQHFEVGSGLLRRGKRLLTVGTDCSVGKMFTSLALEKAMRARGMKADFRATGQTGIFIAGGGVSVDAVVADFISGAVEYLSPENDDDHWDIIEGQGSLFHPSFAGVSLGLLHGAQAHRLVMCHDPNRSHMRGLPHYAVPELRHCISVNEQHGRLTNPDCTVIGVSVNTSCLADEAARSLLMDMETSLGLPVVDAWRYGAERLVDAL